MTRKELLENNLKQLEAAIEGCKQQLAQFDLIYSLVLNAYNEENEQSVCKAE